MVLSGPYLRILVKQLTVMTSSESNFCKLVGVRVIELLSQQNAWRLGWGVKIDYKLPRTRPLQRRHAWK
jgi:hypothetical protein